MRAPYGVVPALCTTASAFLATGSGLLAFFIKVDANEITTLEAYALFTMLLALFFIGIVPWLVTKPLENEATVNLRPARKSLATGTALFFTAMVIFLISACGHEENTASQTNQRSQADRSDQQ